MELFHGILVINWPIVKSHISKGKDESHNLLNSFIDFGSPGANVAHTTQRYSPKESEFKLVVCRCG